MPGQPAMQILGFALMDGCPAKHVGSDVMSAEQASFVMDVHVQKLWVASATVGCRNDAGALCCGVYLIMASITRPKYVAGPALLLYGRQVGVMWSGWCVNTVLNC